MTQESTMTRFKIQTPINNIRAANALGLGWQISMQQKGFLFFLALINRISRVQPQLLANVRNGTNLFHYASFPEILNSAGWDGYPNKITTKRKGKGFFCGNSSCLRFISKTKTRSRPRQSRHPHFWLCKYANVFSRSCAAIHNLTTMGFFPSYVSLWAVTVHLFSCPPCRTHNS